MQWKESSGQHNVINGTEVDISSQQQSLRLNLLNALNISLGTLELLRLVNATRI
jgi:hypothetical protein